MQEALADALARLKVAERTAAELRTTLLKKHSPESVDAALAWLTARKLLSDDRAAEATLRPRSTGRRAEGDARLRERLVAKGTVDAAIDTALSGLPSEAERMDHALAGKFRAEEPSQRARAGRFLLSRGFDEESVGSALDRFFGDADLGEA